MKVFTPSQVEQIMSIIDKHHYMFISANIGTEYLTQYEKSVLRNAGIDIKKWKDHKGTIDEAFTFGILAQAIGDERTKGMNYKDFKKFMQSKNYLPLTGAERGAIDALKYQSYSDVKNLANKVKTGVSTTIFNEDRKLTTELDKVITDSAKKTIEHRKSVKSMISEIGHKTGEWERNLGMIAEYTLHNAYEEGRANQMEKEAGGKEVYVYKDVYAGACKYCIKHYLTGGIGSQPRIFKLSELRANGTNIGKKAKDWLPTLGSLHPYCRCTVNKLQEGYVWDEEKGSFVMGKYEPKNEAVKNRAKVTVRIGNKEYKV